MLEGLATWFLNNYLGKYLENLNTDQLSIALLHGEVELENVPLRRDALRFVDTAIDVRSGLVGRIKLKIPVSRLKSEPWSIVMEKVYIVAGPQRFEDYDEVKEDDLSLEIKFSALEGIESEWRALHDVQKSGSYYPSYSSWMAYGTSFIGTIIENLQVQIRDVHIRYEDDVTFISRPFACGFSIESLTAHSCDQNWTPKFVYREQGETMAYKVVELQNMAAYLNTDAEIFGGLTLAELKEKMAIFPGKYSTNEFILSPVSASATIKRNCSERPLNSRKTPRLICDLQLNSIPLEISDRQYQCVMSGARSIHQLNKNRKFWRWKPLCNVKGNAKTWWHYATTCYLEEIRRKTNTKKLTVILQKCRENVQYVAAFKKYLDNPMALDIETRECKNAQDISRTYEELKVLRELAAFYLKRERNETVNDIGSSGISSGSDHLINLPDDDPNQQDSQPAQSLLQRWFPLWGGWYANSEKEDNTPDSLDTLPGTEQIDNAFDNKPSLEGEIMDALADEASVVPYKDVIFAQLGFSLKRGTVQLYSKKSFNDRTSSRRLLFEYEFTDTKVECETRPRLKSFKFNLSLGGMYLRDKITPDSVFPLLISPQNVQGAPLYPRSKHISGNLGSTSGMTNIAKSLSNFLPLPSMGSSTNTEEPLFYLNYEKRPITNTGGIPVDFRLHLRSQPLNVVYNPTVVQCVSNFFTIPEDLSNFGIEKIEKGLEKKLAEAKERTKEELKRNINSIFEAEDFRDHKVWDIAFELSAPQLLIPEHFIDRDAMIMVIDFGKLHLRNDGNELLTKKLSSINTQSNNAKSSFTINQSSSNLQKYLGGFYPVSKTEEDIDSDEEEFCTPASSPTSPATIVTPPIEKESENLENVTEASIKRKLYDRYTINLSDMQVIVGRVKDNWKHAHVKGNSQLHILDKFCIALNFERRIVNTNDPNLPNIMIAGNLPKLVVHINEDKVHTLERITRLLLGDLEEQNSPNQSSAACQTDTDFFMNPDGFDGDDTKLLEDYGEEADQNFFSKWEPKSNVDASSKLLLLYFCVSDMSVQLQSQGKSVAELQVTGVKASFTRRPYDTNIAMSVHSLLLVDAMQTFGPNFDLLVASHRQVSVDSVSGSLKGSEPVSPISPGSPDYYQQALKGGIMQDMMAPIEISKALASLQADSRIARELRGRGHSPRTASGEENSNITSTNIEPLLSENKPYKGRLSGPQCQSGIRSPSSSFDKRPNPSVGAISPLPVDIQDPHALISVDILIVSPNCPTFHSAPGTLDTGPSLEESEDNNEQIQILSIQFNSLDVIANQETIVELVSFVKRVSPSVHSTRAVHHKRRRMPTREQSCQTEDTIAHNIYGSLTSMDSLYNNSSFMVDRSASVLDVGGRYVEKQVYKKRIELTADFQRLNILLLRAVTGKMIGTALLTEVRIHSTINENDLEATGELGGLQVMNLLTGTKLHQKIFSVGKDPVTEGLNNPRRDGNKLDIHTQLYPEPNEGYTDDQEGQALRFDIVTHDESVSLTKNNDVAKDSDAELESKKLIDVKLRMASVCYLHSSSFLEELNSCATDFKGYMSNIAHSIRSAATDLALGIVNRRTESIGYANTMDDVYGSAEVYGRNVTPSKGTRRGIWRSGSFRGGIIHPSSGYDNVGFDHLSSKIRAPAPTPRHIPSSNKIDDFRVCLDIVMKTPIVVVPRHERSFEVLVAHLGCITIQNEFTDDPAILQNDPNVPPNSIKLDRVIVKVNDMNVHSLNLSEKIKRTFNRKKSSRKLERETIDNMDILTELERMSAEQMYSIASPAVPILHDTAIDLCIVKIQTGGTLLATDESYNSFVMSDLDVSLGNDDGKVKERDKYQVKAKVTKELKISLHRCQYEQVLDSTRNISNTSDKIDTSNQTQTTKIDEKETVSDFASTAFTSNVKGTTCNSQENKSLIDGSFEIPQLMLELRGDMLKKENMSKEHGQGLVSLKFHEFVVSYHKSEKYKSTVEVSLGTLVMEDLLLNNDSPHRKLATSVSKERREAPLFGNLVAPGLSSSCPELWYHQTNSNLSSSLPSNLDNELLYNTTFTKRKDMSNKFHPGYVFYGKKTPSGTPGPVQVEMVAPATPPPSVCSSRASPILSADFRRDLQKDDNLVHIQILNIEKACPDFVTRHNSTNRFIDIDFNTLDIIFNLQTWVIVLDFFGIGSGSPSKFADAYDNERKTKNMKQESHPSTYESTQKSESFNTEMDVKVKSLSVILNKPDYELASATARNYTSKISLRDNNFAIWGSLGNFSLKDLTSHGLLYKDRISSKRAKQAFNFHLFKFGAPDPNLKRPQDATLKIRMSSIIYVHTNRFYSELVAFFNQFHQLHSVTNRMREAAAGACLNEIASRGTRVKLDIEAGSPLLILPMSSFSSQILVIDLGRLEIMNVFRFSGDEGTISTETLGSVESSDVLGSKSRARSGSRSSRSSVRSKSSTATRNNPVSPGLNDLNSSSERIRIRNKISIARKGVLSDTGCSTDVDEADIGDKIKSLPSEKQKCLLDVLFVSLKSMDLRTAERISGFASEETLTEDDIHVGSFIVHLQPKQVLKEKCELKLQIERNLDKAFNHRVPDISVKGGLSRVHATVDGQQFMLIKGLLEYNFGECLDDLQFEIPTNEYTEPSLNTILSGHVWTGMFMDIELLNVILDILTTYPKEDTCLARVNLIKSRLIYESFSDSSKDVDLVSQEILLDDFRFQDCPMNKRPNVFSQILQPMTKDMLPQGERTSLLQAEVHYRSTHDVNRFTILLNNMRLMGIFDWWTAVLQFISQSTENPNPPQQKDLRGLNKVQANKLGEENSYASVHEPLYSTAGIVTRRVRATQNIGPVFELKLNITDSEFIIVANPSQSDSSSVILRSTTVISYRPDMFDRPFSCNLNNAEVFSCVLSNKEESALSIIDPVTINLEIGSRGYAGSPSKGLLDLADDPDNDQNINRIVEIQLQQLNIRLSYNDWLMFHTILESFPRQARQALSTKEATEKTNLDAEKAYLVEKKNHSPPMNIKTQILKLMVLGFGRKDCELALQACDGQIDEAAIWLTQNAPPIRDALEGVEAEQYFHDENTYRGMPQSTEREKCYLDGSNVSFNAFEFKTSGVNICIIDDCKDADVPVLEVMLQQLNLKHEYGGKGKASSTITGSYYNRSLSSWEPFLEPWRCGLEWKVLPIGTTGRNKRYSVAMETKDVVNLNLTSTLIDLYKLTIKNWTEDYYLLQPATTHPTEDIGSFVHNANVSSREDSNMLTTPALYRRRPFVPFALKNETGCTIWFATQTKMATSHFGPNRQRKISLSSNLEGDIKWQKLESHAIIPFTFEDRGKIRHINSHDVKVHQLIVRVDGWTEVSPVSVDRVGTYFRQAAALSTSSLPPARVVFRVQLEGSARKLVTIRSALTVSNLLPYPIELKLDNSAFEKQRPLETHPEKEVEIISFSMKPKEALSIPLNYVWARIFARPKSGGIGQWKYSEKPINWYHIMSINDNSMEIHSSFHGWNTKKEASKFCVSVKRLNYPIDTSTSTQELFVSSKTSETEEFSPMHLPWIQPAHLITFTSPIIIENLLPCHLTYQLIPIAGQDVVVYDVIPGKKSYLSADISSQTTLRFTLEMFPGQADLKVSPGDSFETRLKFLDNQSRSLYVSFKVECKLGGAILIAVFSQFWLVNKTGLPLLFKEEGNSSEIHEAAGQEEEHEVARMAAPLMFSFTGKDSSTETPNTSLSMRVGKELHPYGRPQFCSKFHLQPGSTVRRLRVAPEDSRRVDIVYLIGIETRIGKGRYRDTLIVTLSPRFQLHNQSQYKLQIAQSCYATTFQDPEAETTYLQAYPKSTLAFHWPRLDFDQLLRVRMLDMPNSLSAVPSLTSLEGIGASKGGISHWSGAFMIDDVDSFHVMIRSADDSGRGTFIRVEVGTVGATFYTVFFDAANFPPPFRIDNFSEVPITYYQNGVQDVSQLRSTVKPHFSVPYALDEPTLDQQLSLAAPGGTTEIYNMNVIGAGIQLTYENFIYIAMTSTSESSDNNDSNLDWYGRIVVSHQPLVLDVEGTRVILAPKEAGKRSQLWRMTSTGMLVHEGSSPPQDPRKSIQSTFSDGLTTLPPLPNTNVLVLDIAGTAVQPHSYTPLMLRKPDERRQLTQRWKFTDDGRLVCSHRGLYVQAKDGFMGLVAGNDVVLGPSLAVTHERTANGVPIEQAICRKRLRPGSGFLSVGITTDGPTRVLQISDAKSKIGRYARLEERDWNLINESKRPNLITMDAHDLLTNEDSSSNQNVRKSSKTLYDCDGNPLPNETEFQLIATIKSGIGLSLVSREPAEELLYLFMSNVLVEYQTSPRQTVLDGSIQNIQIDNQLFEAQTPIVMFVSPSNKNDEYRHMPAIHFASSKSKNGSTENAEIYKHLMVTVKNVTLNLEEELICKVLKFAGITKSDTEMEHIDESAFESQRAQIANTTEATRYYFGTLKLSLNQVKLSVSKSDKPLPQDLQIVKKKLGLGLITFEDANVDLEPFIRVHPFETVNFLTNSVLHHYQDELLSQAVLILGSTDFLGNPIGFLNDISEGVSGLVSEGNIGGLIKNVAHGAANSTAKVTGSLSYGISKATVHERYDERRLMLRKRRGEKSKEHLMAGLKGLGFGMLGGLTSIASETYIGVANQGITGFFTGLGWGLVGTITKPAIGVLDLATGAATAVKESSRSVYKQLPPRLRPPRLVLGVGGSMPNYTRKTALGQELLHKMNGRNYSEIFVAHEQLRAGHEDLQILISTQRIIVFSQASEAESNTSKMETGHRDSNDKSTVVSRKPASKQVLTISHEDLICARVVSHQDSSVNVQNNLRHYIELMVRSEGVPHQIADQQKRPQVRCDSEQIARAVVQDINYARNMHEEMTQAVNEKLESDE